ncbi:hypothetical protein ACPF04_05705 [Campylobacter sp. MOP51]|uniref:hypothetical protein n=1 Tax=Campylobacter canis TaxID=3378588 RepID=UPI003C5A0C7E
MAQFILSPCGELVLGSKGLLSLTRDDQKQDKIIYQMTKMTGDGANYEAIFKISAPPRKRGGSPILITDHAHVKFYVEPNSTKIAILDIKIKNLNHEDFFIMEECFVFQCILSIFLSFRYSFVKLHHFYIKQVEAALCGVRFCNIFATTRDGKNLKLLHDYTSDAQACGPADVYDDFEEKLKTYPTAELWISKEYFWKLAKE